MDADHPKARGFSKFNKNKLGHGKAKPIPRAAPHGAKSKLRLESNWGRYAPRSAERTLDSSTDFALLASAPITRGSHFQFKSDKDYTSGEVSDTQTYSELFNLDLDLLNNSLSTIPFHVRNSIDEEYFSKNQEKIMAATALENKELYTKYLCGSGLVKNDVKDSVFKKEVYVSTEEESSDDENNVLERGRDEVDVIVPEQKLEAATDIPQTTSKGNQEDDLEQWLDDVLDD